MTYLVNPLDGDYAGLNGTCTYVNPCALLNTDPCYSVFCIHCPQNALYCDYPATNGYSPTNNPSDPDA